MRNRKQTLSSDDAGNDKTSDKPETRAASGNLFSAYKYFAVLVFIFFMINVMTPLDPAAIVGPIVRHSSNDETAKPVPSGNIESVTTRWFTSHGIRIHSWVVLPKSALGPRGSKPPVVVLAHGFGAQKDLGLFQYAKFFADGGIASVLIDYANFGGSDGDKRNLVDPPGHVDNICDVVEQIIASAEDLKIDKSRIGLWGTSLSGGHVLIAAARLGGKIRAIVSQVPSLDGIENLIHNLKSRSILATLRVILMAITDLIRNALGLSPVSIPIVNIEGQGLAVMGLTPDEMQAYLSKHPPSQNPPKPYLGGWVNRTPARGILSLTRFRPILDVPKVTAPILFVHAYEDSIVPNHLVPVAMSRAKNPRSKVVRTEWHHFTVYTKGLHHAADAMVAFLIEQFKAA